MIPPFNLNTLSVASILCEALKIQRHNLNRVDGAFFLEVFMVHSFLRSGCCLFFLPVFVSFLFPFSCRAVDDEFDFKVLPLPLPETLYNGRLENISKAIFTGKSLDGDIKLGFYDLLTETTEVISIPKPATRYADSCGLGYTKSSRNGSFHIGSCYKGDMYGLVDGFPIMWSRAKGLEVLPTPYEAGLMSTFTPYVTTVAVNEKGNVIVRTSVANVYRFWLWNYDTKKYSSIYFLDRQGQPILERDHLAVIDFLDDDTVLGWVVLSTSTGDWVYSTWHPSRGAQALLTGGELMLTPSSFNRLGEPIGDVYSGGPNAAGIKQGCIAIWRQNSTIEYQCPKAISGRQIPVVTVRDENNIGRMLLDDNSTSLLYRPGEPAKYLWELIGTAFTAWADSLPEKRYTAFYIVGLNDGEVGIIRAGSYEKRRFAAFISKVPDFCPLDLNKTNPGICGCGFSDADSDSDGVVDCNDLCPKDPNKILPGTCGCAKSDKDSDHDGTPDCIDPYPFPRKYIPTPRPGGE